MSLHFAAEHRGNAAIDGERGCMFFLSFILLSFFFSIIGVTHGPVVQGHNTGAVCVNGFPGSKLCPRRIF